MAVVLESRTKYKLAEERQLSAKQHKKHRKQKQQSDITCCCSKFMAVCNRYCPGLEVMADCS